ncbi:hypothetical protein [Nonomuraea indica]|uniref:Uncharacterized protein n=1 Tax=Nonomuraea indica TaxID=1581193 RepID=A0ABW8A9T4_9ACTN|nr:hypothetical protein [Nonomuraea indica]
MPWPTGPRLLWLIFVVEVAFGLVQLAPWWWSRRTDPSGELAGAAARH